MTEPNTALIQSEGTPAATRRRHPFARYAARRVAAGLLTLLVVSVLIFVGTEVLPGDVATAVLGRNATPEALAAVRDQLDLDRPAYQRYFQWLGDFVRGDLGVSAARQAQSGTDVSVSSLISGRITNTIILAVLTMLLLVPLGIALGILVATRAGRPTDHAISLGSVAVISLPEFVTATILILVFAGGWLELFPPVSLVPTGKSVFSDVSILVLPIATLLAASLAQMIRMVRAGMLDALRSDYVQMARLCGYGERRVLLSFAFRNTLAPTIQVIALNLQWLVGGIVVTEFVFGYPGIGQGLVQAVSARDTAYVQSVSLIFAIFYVSLNVIADLLVVYAIPKLRTAAK
jgi:peptide/nickel transport system permease protein